MREEQVEECLKGVQEALDQLVKQAEDLRSGYVADHGVERQNRSASDVGPIVPRVRDRDPDVPAKRRVELFWGQAADPAPRYAGKMKGMGTNHINKGKRRTSYRRETLARYGAPWEVDLAMEYEAEFKKLREELKQWQIIQTALNRVRNMNPNGDG